MARTTARNTRPSNLTKPVTIHALQRKNHVAARVDYPGEPALHGRFRQEEVLDDGRRYLAVHWYGLGVATYVQDAEDVVVTLDEGLYHNCRLVHWGL